MKTRYVGETNRFGVSGFGAAIFGAGDVGCFDAPPVGRPVGREDEAEVFISGQARSSKRTPAWPASISGSWPPPLAVNGCTRSEQWWSDINISDSL